MTELQTTLHFHRKDRVLRHCGFSGKHPIYLLETSPGKRYLVRNASLKSTAKSFGKAKAVLAESDVSGTDCDADRVRKIRWEGPAAAEGRAFCIDRMLGAVDMWRDHAKTMGGHDAANNARFEALTRGEEIPMYGGSSSGDGNLIRKKPGTEPADGKIQIEEFYDSKRNDAEWAKYQDKLARGESVTYCHGREPRVWAEDKYRKTFEWEDQSKRIEENKVKADNAEKLAKDLGAQG